MKTVLCIAFALVAIALAAAFGFARVLFARMLTRTGVTRGKKESAPDAAAEEVLRQRNEKRAALLAAGHETWERTSFDGLKLRARYIPSERDTDCWVLCVHGYTATGPNEYAWFFDFYRRWGFHMLLPDNRAHGESEGENIGMGVLDSRDIRGWIDEIVRRTDGRCRILLHGVSMGSATVLTVAGREMPAQVRGVIADCGYTSVWDEFSYQLKVLFHLPPFPVLHVASMICRVRAGYGLKDFSPLDAVKRMRVPVLFVHGDADTFVPTGMGKALYAACRADKELLLVAGAAHAASYRTDPEAYERAARTLLGKAGMADY